VYDKANKLMIAKPFRSQQFINLTGYEIIGSNISISRF
jgi:hypothetical protein